MALKNSPEENYYSDSEVEDSLNNSILAMLRWDRLKGFKEVRGKTLREFVEALVDTLTTDVMTEEESLKIAPELAVAMQAASLLIIYQFVIPEGSRKKNLLRTLMKG